MSEKSAIWSAYMSKFRDLGKKLNFVEGEMWRGGELASNWGESPVRQGLYTLHNVTLSDMFMDDCTRTKEQSLTPVHGWLNKDNGAVIDPCSWMTEQGQCSSHWPMCTHFKPCLTGDSPQLLVSSPPFHISTSTKFLILVLVSYLIWYIFISF